MVDVSVHAVDPRGIDTGMTDRVVPRRLTDRKQLVVLPHQPQRLEVWPSRLRRRKILFGKQVWNQVVDDSQPMGLVEFEPVRENVLAATAELRQEEAGCQHAVDAAVASGGER